MFGKLVNHTAELNVSQKQWTDFKVFYMKAAENFTRSFMLLCMYVAPGSPLKSFNQIMFGKLGIKLHTMMFARCLSFKPI